MGQLKHILTRPISSVPLASYRILFGLLMTISGIRFWYNGWIERFYINPDYHFSYYGFEWVKALDGKGMYILFAVCILSALFIALGLLYRISTVTFFLSFTYIELIDKTTYLNHYYFVSIVAFLLIFIPANAAFSIDNLFFKKKRTHIPAWTKYALLLQISIVYFYAGVAKINYDWLIEAEPLTTWLKPRYDTPIVGVLFRKDWMLYLLSWCGMLFDCLIPFLLLYKRTRLIGFTALVFFHLFTGFLFPIGVFPYVMICGSILFFSDRFHFTLFSMFSKIKTKLYMARPHLHGTSSNKKSTVILGLLAFHFVLQLLLPWRYLLYPGDLFWTQEGYRFSWRVMLAENQGNAQFYLKHPDHPGYVTIDKTKFLHPQQIKQMSFQPDMILQFAHHLKEYYTGKTITAYGDTLLFQNPQICADVYVKLNNTASRKLIDKSTILSDQAINLAPKKWLIHYDD